MRPSSPNRKDEIGGFRVFYRVQDPALQFDESDFCISRARTLDEVVATIRASARSLVGCEGIAIVRREGELCYYVEEDAIAPLWKGEKFPASACISGWSMINRQTVVVPDVRQVDRISHELYAGTFVRAVAMAPIRREDPVGAIGAYWSQTYEPTQWEVETLEALAEAAATPVENIGFAARLKLEGTPGLSSPDLVTADYRADIQAIAGIAAVPMILDVALRMTKMGFAAIARVTETRWITCSSLDRVDFGLKPGDELPIENTLCNETAITDSRSSSTTRRWMIVIVIVTRPGFTGCEAISRCQSYARTARSGAPCVRSTQIWRRSTTRRSSVRSSCLPS